MCCYSHFIRSHKIFYLYAKIHISIIGEKLDENIELILIQEYVSNDSKICNRLSIQSKTFNNNIFQKFFINGPTY